MGARQTDQDPSEKLWQEIVRQSLEDETGPELGPAAQKHLAEGRAVYYSDDAYPGETIRHYPDGHREIVALDTDNNEILVRAVA